VPGGRQSRRSRREPRPHQGLPGAPRRRASPKVLAGGAAVAAVVILGIVVVGVLSAGSSKTSVPAVGRLAGGLPGSAGVWKLFKGIPQSGARLGRVDAPVTLVEYVDLQCPYCREFETTVLPRLIERDVRSGKLKLELRALAFIGPDSVRGRGAALAAGDQNREYDLAELLYFNQGVENTGWLSGQMVESAAASIPGMRVPAMLDAMSSAGVSAKAASLDAEATAGAVRSTPTILVGKTGAKATQVSLSSPSDYRSVQAAVDRALAAS
jgi:protein-disulfide isomerase